MHICSMDADTRTAWNANHFPGDVSDDFPNVRLASRYDPHHRRGYGDIGEQRCPAYHHGGAMRWSQRRGLRPWMRANRLVGPMSHHDLPILWYTRFQRSQRWLKCRGLDAMVNALRAVLRVAQGVNPEPWLRFMSIAGPSLLSTGLQADGPARLLDGHAACRPAVCQLKSRSYRLGYPGRHLLGADVAAAAVSSTGIR